MLNAAMFAPEASVGAADACRITRICRPGTVAKPTAPISTRLIIVATWLVAVSAKTARTTVSSTSNVSRVAPRFLSAALPPTRLPTNRPAPNRISSQGTAVLANPLTSVSVNAM